MFYYLNGKVSLVCPDSAVIDCNGIGYEVTITPNTASALSIGADAKLFIVESIGENNYDLFGFRTETEKKFFRLLTGVSGIGPKAAMSILSYNTPDLLTLAIINGDEKSLTACPGIGKKTAQRVILELKDKIAKEASSSDISIPSMASAAPAVKSGAYEEAVTALTVLGYNTAEVVPIIKQVYHDGMKTDEIIRAVLKYMI